MAFFFFGDRLFFGLSLGEFVCDGGVSSCCRFSTADGSFISTRDSSSLDGSTKSCVPGAVVTNIGRVGILVGMLT